MKKFLFIGIIILIPFLVYFSYEYFPQKFAVRYVDSNFASTILGATSTADIFVPIRADSPTEWPVKHIETPEEVHGLYLTSWVAGVPELRNRTLSLLNAASSSTSTSTKLNAVVIDIKDYSGTISFEVNDPILKSEGSVEQRIKDIDYLIKYLHDKGVYVIGRISVFQDSYFVNKHPEYAVKSKKNKGKPWKDHKGISWLDAGSEDVWEYVVRIGNEAYNRGFDELNFDYIRFPSDGDMSDVKYDYSGTSSKPVALKKFFKYLHDEFEPKKIPISADLFGMTTTSEDDLGIGQLLENTLPYFNYVSPMVYPSHYPAGWNGFKLPDNEPYKVIKIAMDRAVERAMAIKEDKFKLRPWLQDFELHHVPYTGDMIKAEIKAVEDVGLNSWLMWDPSNKYYSTEKAIKN